MVCYIYIDTPFMDIYTYNVQSVLDKFPSKSNGVGGVEYYKTPMAQQASVIAVLQVARVTFKCH